MFVVREDECGAAPLGPIRVVVDGDDRALRELGGHPEALLLAGV